MLELRLLPDEGIRDDKVEDQVRVLRAAHHAEVVQRQLRVNGADRLLHKGAHVVELSVVRHDGIVVNDKVHPQLPQGVALDIVEDVVAQQRVLAAVHLGMHAGEALAGTIIMRQDEPGDGLHQLLARRLAKQRADGILRRGPAGPENEQRHKQADPAVHLPV